MNEHDIRGMVTDAVPNLSNPDDRVTQVRERATNQRQRQRSIVAGAAILVAVAAATTLPMVLRGEPVEPFTAGAGTTSACPPYSDTPPKLGQGAAGALVPDGAVRATMCVYRPSEGSWTTDTATIDKDVTDVIAALNALPDHNTFIAQHPEAGDAGCFGSLRPQYRMRFEYPDGSDRAVVFAMNCGTVESDGVVRYGEIPKALDKFTEHYRDQGGTVPPPPWKW